MRPIYIYITQNCIWVVVSTIIHVHPNLGEMIQVDYIIFFKWVQPPTGYASCTILDLLTYSEGSCSKPSLEIQAFWLFEGSSLSSCGWYWGISAMPIVILSCYVLCLTCFMYWNMYIRTPGKTTTYEHYIIFANMPYLQHLGIVHVLNSWLLYFAMFEIVFVAQIWLFFIDSTPLHALFLNARLICFPNETWKTGLAGVG